MTGNPLLDLLVLALPAALAALWWTGSGAHERAVEHARQACQNRQLQFLDQTVALVRMRPARSPTGSSCLKREFRFEFTGEGEFRDEGNITMLGHNLSNVYFPYMRDEAGNRIYTH
ncbi:DUF3301 domain-containing protein [Granulosicoccus antarcticus]|uniref:DUF3301 domain-containing protein n=1 Tax=Granulosicoccus antarcticus IMCC3135 TaxID=1192854 RepID=A0A2Z2P263_9GAMM|nr:DUF3301 domain-containing protein [Granulosicoccus antarcticus]ASJ76681.1 hypothetical protein IMCC3135_33185 [Granulosicoccus antarcticus IMCC3135]